MGIMALDSTDDHRFIMQRGVTMNRRKMMVEECVSEKFEFIGGLIEVGGEVTWGLRSF